MAVPFISREDLSDYIGRDVTADDGALEAVDAACEICRDLAEQSFTLETNDDILLDGTGTEALLLPELPVTQLNSVEIDGEVVTDYVLGRKGIVYRRSSTFASDPWADCIPPAIWPLGRQNIGVNYSHGYDTIPSSIRIVALTIAARLVIQGVAQYETVGNVSVRYDINATDLTAGERRILYKARVPR